MPQNDFDTQFAPARQDIDTQWRIEAKAMDNTWFKDRQSWQSAKSKLTAKYRLIEQKARSKLQGQMREQQQEQQAQEAEQQRVQELVGTDVRGLPREQQAQLRMELPPEAERIVFQQPDVLSVSQMGNRALADSINYYAKQAADTPGLEWGPPKKTGEGLLRAYGEWKDTIQYDSYGPVEQKQLDAVWDINMSNNKIFNKWENKKVQNQLRVLRGRGKGAAAIRERVVGKSPLGRSIITGLSPVATAIQAGRAMMSRRGTPAPQQPQPMQQQQPVEQPQPTGKIRVKGPNGQVGSIPASQWDEAQAAGYTRI